MTAERDSMTLNEVSVPALGVEERSDEAPRAGRARPTPDPEVVAKPKRRQFSVPCRLRRGAGMYGVELYAAVRLAVVDEGLSHLTRRAARFGIDRRTVKKMLSYSAPPGYPPDEAGQAAEAGRVHRHRRRDPGGGHGSGRAAQAAPHGACRLRRGAGDVRRGALCGGSTGGRRGVEPSRGGPAVRHRPSHGEEDAELLGAAGIPPDEAGPAAQAGRVHRHRRRDPGGGHGSGRAAQAAPHGASDLRAAATGSAAAIPS